MEDLIVHKTDFGFLAIAVMMFAKRTGLNSHIVGGLLQVMKRNSKKMRADVWYCIDEITEEVVELDGDPDANDPWDLVGQGQSWRIEHSTLGHLAVLVCG